MCDIRCVHATVCPWLFRGQVELVFSCHVYKGSRDQTQRVWPPYKHSYTLSHLDSPKLEVGCEENCVCWRPLWMDVSMGGQYFCPVPLPVPFPLKLPVGSALGKSRNILAIVTGYMCGAEKE